MKHHRQGDLSETVGAPLAGSSFHTGAPLLWVREREQHSSYSGRGFQQKRDEQQGLAAGHHSQNLCGCGGAGFQGDQPAGGLHTHPGSGSPSRSAGQYSAAWRTRRLPLGPQLPQVGAPGIPRRFGSRKPEDEPARGAQVLRGGLHPVLNPRHRLAPSESLLTPPGCFSSTRRGTLPPLRCPQNLGLQNLSVSDSFSRKGVSLKIQAISRVCVNKIPREGVRAWACPVRNYRGEGDSLNPFLPYCSRRRARGQGRGAVAQNLHRKMRGRGR